MIQFPLKPLITTPLVSWFLAGLLFVVPPTIQEISHGLLNTGITQPVANTIKTQGLIITSSGLHCALSQPDTESDPAINWQSIYLPASSVSSFQGIGRVIKRLKPDIIVLQMSVLPRNPHTGLLRVKVRQLKRYWGQILSAAHPAIESFFHRLTCKTFETRNEADRQAMLEIAETRIEISKKNSALQIQFIQKLIESQKPLILLSQPYPDEAESYRAKIHETVIEIITPLKGAPNLNLLSYNGKMTSEMFYDPFHMIPKFSTPFKQWFLSETQNILQR